VIALSHNYNKLIDPWCVTLLTVNVQSVSSPKLLIGTCYGAYYHWQVRARVTNISCFPRAPDCQSGSRYNWYFIECNNQFNEHDENGKRTKQETEL